MAVLWQMHDVVRTSCMDYLQKERDHFSPYVTQGGLYLCSVPSALAAAATTTVNQAQFFRRDKSWQQRKKHIRQERATLHFA